MNNFIDNHDWKAEFRRLEGAFSPHTLRAYYTDIGAFVDWCEQRSLDWLPTTSDILCRHLNWMAQKGLKFTTIRRRLYAVRRLNMIMDAPELTRDLGVDLTVRRIRRAQPNRPGQARGLTGDVLKRMIDTQPDNPWGLRNKAILSLGYDLLARRSEITALRTCDVTWRPDGTLEVIVRRSKADPFGMGRLAFTSQRSAELVGEWLAWRGPEIGPLFCGIYQGVAIDRALSGASVKLVVKNAARAVGYDESIVGEFSAHSLRVGAAQDLLRNGHDTAAIMRAGGWSSVTVLGQYLAKAEHNVWA
jgi:integrase/recombinase XerD